MRKGIVEKIRKVALRLLKEAGPEGMETSEIVNTIHSEVGGSKKTVETTWWKMHSDTHKNKITRIKKGLYRLSKFDSVAPREVNEEGPRVQEKGRGRITQRIREEAFKLLEEAGPDGMRTAELQKAIHSVVGGSYDTIQGTWYETHSKSKTYKEKITKIGYGLYRLSKFNATALEKEGEEDNSRLTHGEDAYYKPFADYLKKGLEVCDVASPLGGNKLGGRPWTNPDVIAAKKFQKALNIPPVIVTAEVKVSTLSEAIIRGFGQCCAYKLFSHKVYLVVPNCSAAKGILEEMCRSHQIGLVVFNKGAGVDNPEWNELLRAPIIEPDHSFLNDLYSRLLADRSKGTKEIRDFLEK